MIMPACPVMERVYVYVWERVKPLAIISCPSPFSCYCLHVEIYITFCVEHKYVNVASPLGGAKQTSLVSM